MSEWLLQDIGILINSVLILALVVDRWFRDDISQALAKLWGVVKGDK